MRKRKLSAYYGGCSFVQRAQVYLCIQRDAGTGPSLNLAIWPARVNAALDVAGRPAVHGDPLLVIIEVNGGENAEALVEIAGHEFPCIFTVGNESFSVKRLVPVLGNECGGPGLRSKADFLFPSAAADHFPVGVVFDVWSSRVIGKGVVLESRG